MARKGTATVVIARPLDEVFAFLADFESHPRWTEGHETARWVTDGPIAVGRKCVQGIKTLSGKVVDVELEVSEYVPGERIAYRTGPIPPAAPALGTMTVRVVEGGTEVRYTVETRLTGCFAAINLILPWLIRADVRKSLGRLKGVMEGGTDESSD